MKPGGAVGGTDGVVFTAVPAEEEEESAFLFATVLLCQLPVTCRWSRMSTSPAAEASRHAHSVSANSPSMEGWLTLHTRVMAEGAVEGDAEEGGGVGEARPNADTIGPRLGGETYELLLMPAAPLVPPEDCSGKCAEGPRRRAAHAWRPPVEESTATEEEEEEEDGAWGPFTVPELSPLRKLPAPIPPPTALLFLRGYRPPANPAIPALLLPPLLLLEVEMASRYWNCCARASSPNRAPRGYAGAIPASLRSSDLWTPPPSPLPLVEDADTAAAAAAASCISLMRRAMNGVTPMPPAIQTAWRRPSPSLLLLLPPLEG